MRREWYCIQKQRRIEQYVRDENVHERREMMDNLPGKNVDAP